MTDGPQYTEHCTVRQISCYLVHTRVSDGSTGHTQLTAVTEREREGEDVYMRETVRGRERREAERELLLF